MTPEQAIEATGKAFAGFDVSIEVSVPGGLVIVRSNTHLAELAFMYEDEELTQMLLDQAPESMRRMLARMPLRSAPPQQTMA